MRPSDDQIKRFLSLVETGGITGVMLEKFLANPKSVMHQSILDRLIAESRCKIVEAINNVNFPIYKEPEDRLVLVEPKKVVNNVSILVEFRKSFSVPAELQYLFSFVKEHIGQEMTKTVVALGSICTLGKDRYCPVLNCNGNERSIGVTLIKGKWSEEFSFLGRFSQMDVTQT